MKTIADNTKDAGSLLVELLDFQSTAMDLVELTGPYTEFANGRPLPKFVTETTAHIKQKLVPSFSTAFPHISSLVEDGLGSSDAGFQRLHDACFKFGEAQNKLQAKKCVLMADTDRKEISGLFKQVVGDVTVFILIHFGFKEIREETGVMLCVQSYCESKGFTPQVFYGILLQELEDVGQRWYAYEPISPMYGYLMDFDSSFMEECSASNFQLFDEDADKLVSGELDIAAVRGRCLQQAADTVEREVAVTPSTLISRMDLSGT